MKIKDFLIKNRDLIIQFLTLLLQSAAKLHENDYKDKIE